MSWNRQVRPLVALALLLLAATLAAPAVHGGGRAWPPMLAQASPAVTPDAAAERVRAVSGGRILDVRLEGSVYRVKVLLDGGRVRIYRVDAGSGRVLQ